jgi:hypothetical protein
MADATRSVAFDTLDEAKAFAKHNFPAVILEHTTDGWREVLRFDWHWNEERGEPVIELW